MTQKLILCFFMIVFCAKSFSQAKTNSNGEKKEKKINTLIIPTVTYNNSFGAVFGGMASAFYNINSKDTVSSRSKSTLIANYSTNDTWYIIQPNQFYFKEDNYRGNVVFGLGSINFQTFFDWNDELEGLPDGILPILPEEGIFIEYNNQFQFAFLELLKSVYENLYLGGRILYSHALTTFDSKLKPDEETNLFGFGISSQYDIRDSQFAPIKGWNAKFNTLTYLESLGSTNSYTNINFEINKYHNVIDRNVFVYRAIAQIATGDVPFSGQNVVGRDDIRGYSNGKFRANQVYAAQTEYRHWLNKEWGYVAFGGLATAINTSRDIAIDNLLPGIGAGVRYMALPKSNISIGLEGAVGRDDWGVYFRIGETFTR